MGLNIALRCLNLVARVNLGDGFDSTALPSNDMTFVTFFQKHLNQVFSRPVAKQLAFVLFVKRNVIRLHQFNEVLRGIARQSASAKVRVVA